MEPRELLERALTPTRLPDSPELLVGTALALALLLVLPGAVWRLTGIVVTIVHELGHGFAGLLTGRRAVAIRLSPDHSGLTTSHGRAASVPWTTFWGYPAPAVLGAGLVMSGLAGRGATALLVCAAVLAVSLLFMRGILAWLAVPLTAAALLGLLGLAADPWLTSAVVGIGVFLVCGAVRALANLTRMHARGRTRASDAAILAQETRVPGGVWLTLMWCTALACAAGSAWMLRIAIGG